jgi:hypothetical protein
MYQFTQQILNQNHQKIDSKFNHFHFNLLKFH